MSDCVMASDKPALVLLHGLNASGLAWQAVIPLLSGHHLVYAPTAPGHRGGPPPQRRPATASDLVNSAEGYLDEEGLQRPHLVGHSMGGYLAIELARRGRAATVCALAPGGFWASGDGLRAETKSKVQGGAGMVRLVRPTGRPAPLLDAEVASDGHLTENTDVTQKHSPLRAVCPIDTKSQPAPGRNLPAVVSRRS
jgi:pimeloyl-ACP methyl ester carboxylesterase